MTIVGKFHLSELVLLGTRNARAEFSVVSRGDRNASWSRATPSGTIKLGSVEETETAWMLGYREDLRRLSVEDHRKALAGGLDPDSYQARNWPGRGVEFLVYLGRRGSLDEPRFRRAPIARLVDLASVERTARDHAGKVSFVGARGESYTTVSMVINNPSAYLPILAAFTDGYLEWDLRLVPSTDGYPHDGHSFVESSVPEGIYGHDRCAECGALPAEHQ